MDGGAVKQVPHWQIVCLSIIELLKKHKAAPFFLSPVALDDRLGEEFKKAYFNVIKNPMDLISLTNMLPSLSSPEEFDAKTKLV